MIWRDVWDGMPQVIILAEDDAQHGSIEDAVLFLFAVDTSPVPVTTEDGQRLLVHIPQQLLGDTGLSSGLDLTVEDPPNEESH